MRKTPLISGHYYHIYNRGVNFENIFFEKENWRYFLRRLHHYFDPIVVELLTYCMMPNHYHLLVHIRSNDFGQKVMHPFTISYTKAVNKQQWRVGPLFQGPFQAKLVDKNAYLIHLSRYIHLNPVTAGLVPSPQEWDYSSYRDYVRLRNDPLIRTDTLMSQFTSTSEYADFVCSESDPDSALPDSLWFD